MSPIDDIYQMDFPDGINSFSEYHASLKPEQYIKPATAFTESVLGIKNHDFMGQSLSLLGESNKKNFEFREGEVTVWAAMSGVGKSLITGQVALECDEPVFIMSLEMTPGRTLYRLATQALGKAVTFHENTPDDIANVDEDGYTETDRKIVNWCESQKNHLWLFDVIGAVEPDDVFGAIEYAAKVKECKHVFIDNLMRVVSGEDDYNRQKAVMMEICRIANETKTHVHVVHHVRKKDTSFDKVTMADIRGSAAITDNAANVIILNRNMMTKEERKAEVDKIQEKLTFTNRPSEREKLLTRETELLEAPDVTLTVAKQRNSEWTGTVGLDYDKATMRVVPRKA